jgi:hypothetical protein
VFFFTYGDPGKSMFWIILLATLGLSLVWNVASKQDKE